MDHSTEMPEFTDAQADIATKFNLLGLLAQIYIISVPRLTSG